MLLETIQGYTKLSPELLSWYALTASKRYKVYKIPKRIGGERTIEQPSRQIKSLQRILNKILFERFPVHPSSTAYRKGGNIKKNAAIHLKSNFTLHADLESFFPSFKAADIIHFLNEKSNLLDIKLVDFVSKVVCRNGALTIGAPSSPILTNIMMFDFDVQLAEWCDEHNLVYSRYADDLFISSREADRLGHALAKVRKTLKNFKFGQLNVNEKKLTFLSRRYRRTITGLVVTPDRKLSIGLARKTAMKSKIHKFRNGKLAKEEIGNLIGMIAFARDVEPEFYDTLCRKYGAANVEGLMRRTTDF
jgi:RNA-directed DNA polymerase